MKKIPKEIKENLDFKQPIGTSIRIKHIENGCSIGKTPALSITKTQNGWVWYCFRCGMPGHINAKNLSPKQTIERIKSMLKSPKLSLSVPKISLPGDFIPLSRETAPAEAFVWIYDAGLNNSDIKKHGFGWSENYQRVVIPCKINGKLAGWVGRNPFYSRNKKTGAKYITRKQKNIQRLYYFLAGSTEKLIIVEDILSAVKVNKITGLSVKALLTSFISKNDMVKLKSYKIGVWLDADKRREALKYVTKMIALGIKAHFVYTKMDPKFVEEKEMKKLLDF